MNRIDGWDNFKPIRGGFWTLPAGAYKVQVLEACGATSKKTGKEMLVLELDIAEGAYKSIFFRTYSNRKRSFPEANWPCKYYQLTEGDEATIGRYRGLIAAFEESNDGFHWDFDEKALRGKMVGCIFREEEYLGNDNRVHTNTKPWQIIPVSEIRKSSIPEKKCLRPEDYGYGYDIIPDEPIPF